MLIDFFLCLTIAIHFILTMDLKFIADPVSWAFIINRSRYLREVCLRYPYHKCTVVV